MRRAAQLPTLSWHGRSSAVGLPPCSLPPQDLGRVLDGGPIRHGVDSQQLVVPGSPISSHCVYWNPARLPIGMPRSRNVLVVLVVAVCTAPSSSHVAT